MIERALRVGLLCVLVSWSGLASAGAPFPASRVEELRSALRPTVPEPGAALDAFELQAWTVLDGRLRALDRARVKPATLLALKFEWLVWRARVTQYLLEAPADEEFEGLRFETLRSVGSRPNARQLRQLRKSLPAAQDGQLIETAAHFGFPELVARWRHKRADHHEELIQLAGPDKELKILPSAPSKWPLSRWTKREEFDDYRFTKRGVQFRGIEFESGDLFLLHMHEHSDGMYTSYAQPEQLFPHFALFVVLELDGRRLPAVIEIHRMGLRALPLSAYLHPNYSDYIEVYRIPASAQPAHWDHKLSSAALKTLAEPHAYGLDPGLSVPSDRQYLTCAQVGSLMFERSEVQPWRGRSQPTPGAQANLATMDLHLGPYLTPTNFIYDPRDPNLGLRMIGLIDNGARDSMLVRHFMMVKVSEWLSTLTLDLDLFGMDYKIKHWGMRQWEEQTRTGFALVGLFGFTPDNFPGGPAKLMGAIDSLEHGVVKAVKRAERELSKHDALEASLRADTRDGSFVYETWISNPKLADIAHRAGRDFLRYFKPE